jgi:nucleoside-diphosphate-sugar epimerase
MEAHFLVTGGAGFIGGHLAERLVKEGCRVRVLDNLSTGRLSNLDGIRSEIEFVEGDVRDMETCRAACDGMTGVLHQAALPSVPRSITDPLSTNAVNITGTLNMLEAAREAGITKFIFASSSSVYGDTPELPKVETMAENPRSPYAASKLAGEKYCLAYNVCHGMLTVCLRYFNVFGPRQDPDSPYAAVIPRFITALREGRPPIIYGDGLQTRDFTFVADVVQANLQALWSESVKTEVFNIGGGRRQSILDLARLLIRLTGSPQDPAFTEARAGDVRDSQADIEKAARLLGYRPTFDLESGLGEMI